MINSSDVSASLALDTRGVDTLRLQARNDPQQALKGAAQQFEALFMNMMLKSMREATPKDGLFNSDQERFFTSMLDQQLAQSLSSKGVGLADLMVKQLSRATTAGTLPEAARAAQPLEIVDPEASHELMIDNEPMDSTHVPFVSVIPNPLLPASLVARNRAEAGPMTGNPAQRAAGTVVPYPLVREPARGVNVTPATRPDPVVPPQSSAPQDFVNRLKGHAAAASQATGIPARFVLAQAALESGWGKHEIRRDDGSPSFNLFGIKAGRNWAGATVEKVTTEYVNGVAQKMVEKFRAYNSYTEGFRDYANLLVNNPRYASVLNQRNAAGFAYGLQRAGYATDPVYGDKLMQIMNGSAIRQALTVKT